MLTERPELQQGQVTPFRYPTREVRSFLLLTLCPPDRSTPVSTYPQLQERGQGQAEADTHGGEYRAKYLQRTHYSTKLSTHEHERLGGGDFPIGSFISQEGGQSGHTMSPPGVRRPGQKKDDFLKTDTPVRTTRTWQVGGSCPYPHPPTSTTPTRQTKVLTDERLQALARGSVPDAAVKQEHR